MVEDNVKQRPNGVSNGGLENPKKPKEIDPYDITQLELDIDNKRPSAVVLIAKLTSVVFLLYVFICSLDFMSTAFKLISGRTAGELLRNSYIENPVVGLMIGILITVLVQSSSTSTSIFVSMVNSGILKVHIAIPMIFGSNIGTSVTNTIVSLAQITDKGQFRRAFAGATVHDMFNWLTVITMLIIEITTGFLEYVTGLIVDHAFSDVTEARKATKLKILKHITEPFTKYVIQIDSKVINAWSTQAENDTSLINKTMNPCFNAKLEYPSDSPEVAKKCNYLFSYFALSDSTVGIILLVISLVLLCVAMVLLVKILSSMLKGTIALMIRKTINADIPYVPWLTGYVAIVVGAIMTVIVQSSSIFTSTITPLIGIGLIGLERAYPLTLGSNIGTTTTALLASIAGEGAGLINSVQIALVHLLFNIFGILIFYPLPFMRFPIPLCKILGDTTAKYRWFALFYLFVMFLFLPAFVFGVSLLGSIGLYAILLPILIILAVVTFVNVLQNKFPRILPDFLKTWNFLPEPMRSLEPYDKAMSKLPCCKCIAQVDEDDVERAVVPNTKESPMGIDNNAYQSYTSQSRL